MENIDEQKMRLKYFYHIDPETIIRNIKNDTQFQGTQVSCEKYSMLHLIFKHIVDASKHYTQFILSNNGICPFVFFDGTINTNSPNHKSIKNAWYLSGISLFNHCILHSFQKTLIEDNIIKGTVHISAATEPYIKRGAISSYSVHSKQEKMELETSHQTYTLHYTNYQNRIGKYSYTQLQSLNKNTSSKLVEIEKFISTPALYLFLGHNVKIFDNNLEKKSCDNFKLMKLYAQLCIEANNWKEQLSLPADKVLFDTVIEPIYDFTYNSYLFKLFKEELSHPTQPISLKNLFGETFTNILKDYSTTMPMTYNKSIFLKYALEALSISTSLESSFPPPDTPSIGTISGIREKNNINFAFRSLQLLSDYYLTLHYITLPVIEDLWDVLTAELSIKYSDYFAFIEQYHHVITADYTELSDCDFSDGPQLISYEHIYSILDSHLKNKHNQSASYEYLADDSITISLFPNGKEICRLINPLLHREKLRKTAPQASYLSTKLSVSIPDRYSAAPYALETDIFQRSHVNNLFNFVQKLTI